MMESHFSELDEALIVQHTFSRIDNLLQYRKLASLDVDFKQINKVVLVLLHDVLQSMGLWVVFSFRKVHANETD